MNEMSKVAALPVTQQDLRALRKTMRERTLNDHIDDIHDALWPDPAYRRALEAVYDEDAIEGSLAADNFVAAGMIRAYAVKEDNRHVKDKKLATIVKSLNIVLRRYGIGRRERALTIGDQLIQNTTNGE